MSEEESIQVTTTAHSDVGTLRKANEDSYYISEDENLLIVCDGMGGQVAGGLASKIAVETIKDIYYGLEDEHFSRLFPDIDQNLPKSARFLVAAVRVANRRLFNLATKFPKLRGMGTTVVALAFDQETASLVHVGDSRVFRISDSAITQLTEDHSWLNELIEDNEINEEQIETFSQKNVITRALGTAPSVKVDLHCEKYKKDDIYILCTDGLHNAVTTEEIKKEFKKHKGVLDAIVKKLVEKAKSKDGSDNITASAAKVNQDCDPSSQVGISTTIEAEADKHSVKVDKFIQEKYSDSKLSFFGKQQARQSRQPYLTVGLALICSVAFFALGINLRPKQSLSNNSQVAMPQAEQAHTLASNALQNVPAARMTNGVESAEPKQRSAQNGAATAPRQDAVLAVVFFGSSAEYDNFKLEEKAKVLDKFQPYLKNSKEWRTNKFTIFLIDSANNVIRKTSGVEIPDLSGM